MMMNYLLVGVFFLFVRCAFAVSGVSSLPPDAVKVTAKNNPDCIVYLTHKGTLYCTLATIKTSPIAPGELLSYEKQNLVFDHRAWHPVWGEHKDSITSIEYLPVGKSIDKWQELITSQFVPESTNVSAVEFGNRFLKDLKKTGVIYSVHIIEKHPKLFIFEFRVKQPHNLQQDELQKITKGDDGLYIVHYAVKKADMGVESRARWLKNLKSSTLKP